MSGHSPPNHHGLVHAHRIERFDARDSPKSFNETFNDFFNDRVKTVRLG